MRTALRTALLATCAILAGSPSAWACALDESHTTFFFNDVPSGVRAPVAAHVTVISPSLTPWRSARVYRGRYYSWDGFVRVDRVLRGAIQTPVIKLVSGSRSSCSGPLAAGYAGIVFGEIRTNSQGVPELHPTVWETAGDRARRIRGAEPAFLGPGVTASR